MSNNTNGRFAPQVADAVIPIPFEVPLLTGAIIDRFATDPWSATELVAALDALVWVRDALREFSRTTAGRWIAFPDAAYAVTVHVALFDGDGARLGPKVVGRWLARLVERAEGYAVAFALGLDDLGLPSPDELLVRLNVRRVGAFNEGLRLLRREVEGVRVEHEGVLDPEL